MEMPKTIEELQALIKTESAKAVDGYKSIHSAKMEKLERENTDFKKIADEYATLKAEKTTSQIRDMLAKEKMKPEALDRAVKYGKFDIDNFATQIKDYKKDFATDFITDGAEVKTGGNDATPISGGTFGFLNK